MWLKIKIMVERWGNIGACLEEKERVGEEHGGGKVGGNMEGGTHFILNAHSYSGKLFGQAIMSLYVCIFIVCVGCIKKGKIFPKYENN